MRWVKASETNIVAEYEKTTGLVVIVKPTLKERLHAMVEAGLADSNQFFGSIRLSQL